MSIEAMKRMAKAESAASKKLWGAGDRFAASREEASPGRKRVADLMMPYLGTGMTPTEIAQKVGCTACSIRKASKRLGISWKTGKPLEADQ